MAKTGFFSSIANAFGKAVSTVVNGLKSAFNGIAGGISSGANTLKSATQTLYHDAKSEADKIIKFDTDLVNKTENDIAGKDGLVNKGLSDITSIISTPLLLIAGGVAAFLLFSGKNSSFQGQASYTR